MFVRLLRHCERHLKGDGRADLTRYDNDRPKKVTPAVLLRAYGWALLVSGISRRSARSRAERVSFWDVFMIDNCHRHEASDLIGKVGVAPTTKLAKKLRAIHSLGASLHGAPDTDVANKYFRGVSDTSQLDEANIPALDELPFVGATNARFMIRNMGGELIKDDHWILEILRYFRCDLKEIEAGAKALRWKIGRADVVLWSYCEQEVREIAHLAAHLQQCGFAA